MSGYHPYKDGSRPHGGSSQHANSENQQGLQTGTALPNTVSSPNTHSTSNPFAGLGITGLGSGGFGTSGRTRGGFGLFSSTLQAFQTPNQPATGVVQPGSNTNTSLFGGSQSGVFSPGPAVIPQPHATASAPSSPMAPHTTVASGAFGDGTWSPFAVAATSRFANIGTDNLCSPPYMVELDRATSIPPTKQAYQTITFVDRFQTFSLEELRVADYARRVGTSGRSTSAPGTVESGQVRSNSGYADERPRNCLPLLRGPGIEVVVGADCSTFGDPLVQQTWSLPQALLSHHSPFLKAACTHNFKEREEKRITLPTDDPKIFALFVEWIYYGEYTIPLSTGAVGGHTNMDAEAWVLGDKLMSTAFKNYAMDRLYSRHGSQFFSTVVMPEDVAYACNNSQAGSPIRQLFFDIVSTHFSEPTRVAGSAEEWDKVLLDHDDARTYLLRGFRLESGQRKFVKSKEAYMEEELGHSVPPVKSEGTK